jgi:hypothetical protein
LCGAQTIGITAMRLFLDRVRKFIIPSGLIPNLYRRYLFRNGGCIADPQVITSIRNEPPVEARLSCGKRANKLAVGY